MAKSSTGIEGLVLHSHTLSMLLVAGVWRKRRSLPLTCGTRVRGEELCSGSRWWIGNVLGTGSSPCICLLHHSRSAVGKPSSCYRIDRSTPRTKRGNI